MTLTLMISALLGASSLVANAQTPQPASQLPPIEIPQPAPVPDSLKLSPLEGQTVVLSREDCIRIALSDNPTIRVADMEVQRMEYAKKEATGSLFPSIDFSLAYQRSIELQTISMNMGGQTNNIKMGMDNSWNMGFSAAMPLVNAQLWKSIAISKTQILSALEDARSSKLSMVENVNKAYYALLLAKASYDVVKQNYDNALFTAQVFEKQFAAGTASEYDVLRSAVQVRNVEPELLQADISIRSCKLQLKVLLGIDYAVDIEPDITLAEMQRDMLAVTAATDTSLAGNSQLRSLDIQTKLLKQNVDLKKFAWIPTLATQFSLYWSALSNGNALKNQKFNPYSNVALSLNVPIFSGGSKYYGLKGAQVQLAEMALQRENLVNALQTQVELAMDNINRQVRQIASSEQGVRQATKAHSIMQKSFEIGAASYLDLRDSELAETSSRLSYLQSIYNYLVSTAELDTLLGREQELRNAGVEGPAIN